MAPTIGKRFASAAWSREYRRVPFRFHAGKTTESATLSVHLTRPGLVWLGCLSLMPADNIKGMRADVLG